MSQAGLGAVLLTAGTSSRTGQNKLLLEIGGTTLLARAVRTAATALRDGDVAADIDRARAELGAW
jgi:CTP:molybdopterin cytidylyltransferase MocA